MKFVPLEDKVVLKQIEAETTTASGIVIPGKEKEKPLQGEVIAVGPGRTLENGSVVPMTVKVGDKVVYGQYSSHKVKVSEKEEYIIVRQSDIDAIVED